MENLGNLFHKLFCQTEGCTWFQNKIPKKDLNKRELDYFSPLPKEISPNTFRGYLYKLAVDKNIRDACLTNFSDTKSPSVSSYESNRYD